MTEENNEIDKRVKILEAINAVQVHKINILTSRIALLEIGMKAIMAEFKMKIVTSKKEAE